MSDTASPEAVLDAYTRGTATRDVALLKSIFHPEAVMTGYLGGQHLMGGPEPFYGALEGNEVGADYTGATVALTTDGDIASGTTEEKNLLGLNFTNHFHLVKQPDGRWLITAKLFRHG